MFFRKKKENIFPLQKWQIRVVFNDDTPDFLEIFAGHPPVEYIGMHGLIDPDVFHNATYFPPHRIKEIKIIKVMQTYPREQK